MRQWWLCYKASKDGSCWVGYHGKCWVEVGDERGTWGAAVKGGVDLWVTMGDV